MASNRKVLAQNLIQMDLLISVTDSLKEFHERGLSLDVAITTLEKTIEDSKAIIKEQALRAINE